MTTRNFAAFTVVISFSHRPHDGGCLNHLRNGDDDDDDDDDSYLY